MPRVSAPGSTPAPGGQLEWVVGSQWSKGGKSILALRSSYRDKAGVLHSKIVPQLAPGSVVTTPRTCVQYVVTEFGVADLKYKSTVERARALIAIAHPGLPPGAGSGKCPSESPGLLWMLG